MNNEVILKGRSLRELEEIFQELDEPRYRAKQAFRRLNRLLARSMDEFSEFPLALRARLEDMGALPALDLKKREVGGDGTEKLLFEIGSEHARRGARLIETVKIPSARRRTICVSSQSGCSLNCTFCATGRLEFRGNLETWHILDQIYEFARNAEEPLTNVVFMGMGEPFYNYDNVMRAARILNHPEGLNLGARHITISTAGVLPRIEQFIAAGEPFNLAVSLNHADSRERDKIMGINKKYPLDKLLSVCRKFTKILGRKITFEYIMISGYNMDEHAARKLIKVARSVHCKINLIPLNTTFEGMRRPEEREIEAFQARLYEANVPVFLRGSPGRDINAACGMLAASNAASNSASGSASGSGASR